MSPSARMTRRSRRQPVPRRARERASWTRRRRLPGSRPRNAACRTPLRHLSPRPLPVEALRPAGSAGTFYLTCVCCMVYIYMNNDTPGGRVRNFILERVPGILCSKHVDRCIPLAGRACSKETAMQHSFLLYFVGLGVTVHMVWR